MGTKNTEYKNSYNKDNYSRIALYFPKDFKDSISDYCNAADVPMAEFIKDLVYEKIGDYFDDCITEEYVRVQIYSLSSVMIITCGKRWMFCVPSENGHILGAKVGRDCHDQLADYFSKKKPDVTSFNIWKKVMMSSGQHGFKYGDDYDGNMDRLIEKIDPNLKYIAMVKVYDSDEHREQEEK